MIWDRLKTMRCPKCNGNLECKDLLGDFTCSKRSCDFKINRTRFDEVVTKLYQPKSKGAWFEGNNESELNNLGHDRVSRDYGGTTFNDE